MKKVIVSFVLALVSISCSQAQKTEFAPEALHSGLVATDKTETTFEKVLEANKGKIIVIDVWASWCSDCVKGMPKYKDFQQRNPSVVYLYISMDRQFDSWITGIEKHELKGQHFWAPEGMKGAFGKSIDLDWIPRYIIVDQTGKIALYRAIKADEAAMKETIKNLQRN